ncbi:P-loop containing nucleoside triphosphate hydrolase protein [Blakeslea trispora]|nr:P-loop containing nucleoside triphosphate hydrolase protein [Blakeslea trispora]
MQDYSSLGITSIPDRKKLFQLVQSLRQEIPTLENGLVSSPTANKYRFNKSSMINNNNSISASPNTILSDINALNIGHATRRGSGQPSALPPPPSSPQIPTRSRSRTLPTSSDYTRTDFLRSPSSNQFNYDSHDSSESESDSEKPQIRRGSGPLLDPYGVPNRARSSRPYSANSTSTQAMSDLNQKIRVCVRKRPLNKKEIERAEKDIAPTVGVRSINVNEPKMKVDLTKYIEQHNFTFDDVFDMDESNEKIYQRTAQPLVRYLFEGGKATCFAYGQTGSGKTYTMLDPKLGLYVLAARDVFSWIRQPEYEHLSAWIGFYEIYQGQLYDLLNNRKKLFAREDGKQNVVIVGLKEFVIKNVDDLMQVFEYGSQSRSTGSTGANSDSSRSHAVLQILLRPTKNRKKIVGKLSFIDLAGSERGADRGETDVKTRMEGAEINKSLLALKECIRALDQDKRHTPFRQSKLTQVLKDSFVGNSRTCMIATISPNQSNSEHTLNTLRYADRVKELKGEKDRKAVSQPDQPISQPLSSSEEYVEDQFDESDGGSELYQNHPQEDFLLHNEDFPSDGDVNILDTDFPHESQPSPMIPLHSPSPEYKPREEVMEEPVTFDPTTIDSFIRFHRAQIREVTEYSKKETKLLANFSLSLSSRREEQTSLREELKTSSEFINYLDNLDEVLEIKTAAIEALRDRIRHVLGEEEL